MVLSMMTDSQSESKRSSGNDRASRIPFGRSTSGPLWGRQGDKEAMDAVEGKITLVGNVNNPETLYARGPEEVRAEVVRCLEAGVQMIAPECAIPLSTKLENLIEIPRAVKEWHEARA